MSHAILALRAIKRVTRDTAVAFKKNYLIRKLERLLLTLAGRPSLVDVYYARNVSYTLRYMFVGREIIIGTYVFTATWKTLLYIIIRIIGYGRVLRDSWNYDMLWYLLQPCSMRCLVIKLLFTCRDKYGDL